MDVQTGYDDFCHLYSTEEVCAETLYRNKWPAGYRCPICRHSEASVIRTRRLPLFECRRCRFQASLTTDTVMEKSKTPLVKWFRAIYLLSHGATAARLSDAIGVTYKTAWLIAHKIRHAIKQVIAQSPLTDDVRLMESRYGATSTAAQFHTRAVHHPLLAAASLSEDGKIVDVRMARISEQHMIKGLVTVEAFVIFAQQHIAADADLTVTRGLHNNKKYKPLYQLSREAVKRMNQTYFGIGPKHLKSYLDEYSYRYSYITQEQSPVTDLLRQCVNHPAIPYPQLIRKAA